MHKTEDGIHGAYDDAETRTRRHAAVCAALERFPAVKDRFERAYRMPLPRHIAWAAAFFLGLSPRERNLCPVSLSGMAEWFEWLAPGHDDLVAILDERLECRYRRDPPEFVTVASGDSDGSHWGLFYDLPDELPRVLAHGWARDDGAVWESKPTLLVSIRGELRAEGRDPEDRLRVRAIVGWLDALQERERAAHAEEHIGPPHTERIESLAGIGPYLPGYTLPGDIPAAHARDELYGAGGPPLDSLVERARRDPPLALLVGRELHYVDRDETRAVGHELLEFGYQSLGRAQLAEIAELHHRHRDLRSVGIYRPKGYDASQETAEPYVPPPLLAAVQERDRGRIDALLAEGPSQEDLVGACHTLLDDRADGDASVELLDLLLKRAGAAVASRVLGSCLIYRSACAAPHELLKAARRGNENARSVVEYTLAPKPRRMIDVLLNHGARPEHELEVVHAIRTGRADIAERALRDAPATFDPRAYRGEEYDYDDPEHPDRDLTLLHYAVGTASPEIVRLLLDRGLDPAVKDSAGRSAGDLARALWVVRPREAHAIMQLLEPDQPPPPPPAVSGWQPGARAVHAKFGEGTVVAVVGSGDDAKLTMRFAEGDKTLLARFLKAL